MDIVLDFSFLIDFASDSVFTLGIVTEITDAFLNTISALFGGIADGVITVFEGLVIIREAGADGTLYTSDDVITLTTLGTWMLIFMGFSFATTIFYVLFNKVA